MRAEECSVRVGNGELKMEGWPLATGTERKVHTLDRAAAAQCHQQSEFEFVRGIVCACACACAETTGSGEEEEVDSCPHALLLFHCGQVPRFFFS